MIGRAIAVAAGGLLLVGGAMFPASVAGQTVRLGQPRAPQEADLPDTNAIEKGAPAPGPLSSSASPESPPPDEAALNRQAVQAGSPVAGGIYGLDQLQGDAGPDESRASAIPELHVVKKGDTLWSLCDFYFQDPWRWPQVWAQNPLITNPHWLFPGDVVRVRPPGPSPEAPRPPEGAKIITSNRLGSLESKAVMLRQMGFIAAGYLAVSGEISGSREEKIMLTGGDQAYVRFAKDRPLRAGERYSVFVVDREHPVKAKDSGLVLGYIVRVLGDVVVDQVAESNVARGILADVIDPVERGFLVSPAVRQFKTIEPRPSDVNVEASVLASFTPVVMLAAENFVVLGRGKKDGVQVGNRTFVVRRGDGYRRVMESWDRSDPNFPKEVVGELWIVDVREDTSVAWIVRSTKEIRVGEVTELRKGH